MQNIVTAHLCLRDHFKPQFLIDNAGSCLGEVALVGHEAAAAKAARAAQLVQPFGPLGVQSAIGLLVLRLEHCYVLLWCVCVCVRVYVSACVCTMHVRA